MENNKMQILSPTRVPKLYGLFYLGIIMFPVNQYYTYNTLMLKMNVIVVIIYLHRKWRKLLHNNYNFE